MSIIRPPEHNGWTKPNSKNAIWEIGAEPGCRWAIGVHKICERLYDGLTPEDAEAVWTDEDQVRFCIRPRPATMAPDYNEERLASPMQVSGCTENWSTTIFRIGRGVLVKAKWIGFRGRAAEPAAMQLIRREAPSVPVPSVLHHWEDLEWFCYFTVMREVHGVSMFHVWYGLDEEHRKRLVKEIAHYLKIVGDISSRHAVTADGEPLADNILVSPGGGYSKQIKPPRAPGPFTAQELYGHVKAKASAKNKKLKLPSNWGNQLYFCHMDTKPGHFIISDGHPLPPRDEQGLISFSPERQAHLRVVGIIDWERAAFYPRFMVTYQLSGWICLGDQRPVENNIGRFPLARGSDFLEAVIREMVTLGCDDPEDCKFKALFEGS